MMGNFLAINQETVEKIQNNSLSVSDVIYKNDNADSLLELDKLWNAIFFMLKEGADVDASKYGLAYRTIFSGENPINDEDVGYGPATLISQADVKQIAKDLAEVDRTEFDEKLGAVIDGQEQPIHPFSRESKEDILREVFVYGFQPMQTFFQMAADEGKTVLFFIN